MKKALFFLFLASQSFGATTYYLRGPLAAGSWAVTSTWSTVAYNSATNTGTFPAAGDTVLLSNGSGNVTLTGNQASATITASAGCTTTIYQAGNNLTTTGNITLVSGVTVTSSGGFWNMAANTFTPGTVVIPYLRYNSTGTFTETGGPVSVSGIFTVGNGFTATLATNGIAMTGSGCAVSLGSGSVAGMGITFVNSGSIQTTSTGSVNSGLWFNAPGATVTILGLLNYATGTLGWTAGSVYSTGATLNFTNPANMNTSTGVTFANLDWSSATSGGVTLASDLYCTNLILGATSNNMNPSGGFTLYVGGNIFCTSSASLASGTIVMNGSGAVTCQSTGGFLTNATLNINTPAGNVTFAGNLNFSTGTLLYTAGTVNNSACTIQMTGNFVLTDATNNWPNLVHTGTSAHTLLLTYHNSFTYLQNVVPAVLTISTSGCGIANFTGTAGYVYDSAAAGLTLTGGNWTGNGGMLTGLIYQAGNVTLTGPACLGQGGSMGVTLNYLSGTFSGNGSDTLTLYPNNLNSQSGTNFLSVVKLPTCTLTNLSIYGNQQGILKLTAGNTINVTKNFLAIGDPGGCTVQSSSGGSPTYINVSGIGSSDPRASNITFTDVVFSGKHCTDLGGSYGGTSAGIQTFYTPPQAHQIW